MRRAFSILLLLVLGLGPSGIALSASTLTAGARNFRSGGADDSTQPACCRHNGKHHCVMGAVRTKSGKTKAAIAARECCPFAPRALDSTAPTLAALTSEASLTAPSAASLNLGRRATIAALASDRRGQPKRGPPARQTL